MKKCLGLFLIVLPFLCYAQTRKCDTIHGVVVYTGQSNMHHIAGGDYHTYSVKATLIKTDTGIVSIQTEFGYLDLRKNYEFIPMNRLQSARLKSKP